MPRQGFQAPPALKALSDDEAERRKLSKALLPHARTFYADYIDTSKHQPFYRPSSMV